VQLFDRRRTSTTAPAIPTPRESAPSGSGSAASISTVSAPTAPADEPVPPRPDASDPEAAAARSGTDGALAATDLLYILAPSGSGNGVTTATAAGAAATCAGAQGWMLLALHGQRQHWSMPLLSRGAAITAPPRVAQAVAVRVLNDLGVHVRAWHAAGSADQPKYRAELEAPPEPRRTPVGRRSGVTLRPATRRTDGDGCSR
jgi:hypothetical protein